MHNFGAAIANDLSPNVASSNIEADRAGFLWWSVVEGAGLWWRELDCGGVWWSEGE